MNLVCVLMAGNIGILMVVLAGDIGVLVGKSKNLLLSAL
jgi:hypothetical protein